MKLLLEVDAQDYDEARLKTAIKNSDMTWIEELIGGLKIDNAELIENENNSNVYKDISDRLLNELEYLVEDKFITLYETGKINNKRGINYDDFKDEWITDYIVKNTGISYETLDKLEHGESL